MRVRTPPVAVDRAATAVGRMRASCASLVLGLALAWPAPAAGESLLRPVSEDVSAAKRVVLQADPYVMRWRVAEMDREAVFGASAGDEPLVMELFGDVEVRARVESAKTLEGGSRFLAGVLEDGGHFTLFRHSTGAVRGEFHLGEAFMRLRSHSGGRVLVTQGDVSQLPGCGNDQAFESYETFESKRDFENDNKFSTHSHQHSGSHGLSTHSVMHGSSFIPRKAGGTEETVQASQNRSIRSYSIKKGIGNAEETAQASQPIDVLVLYTQRVEDLEGGPEQVQATIENEMAKTNQVLKIADFLTGVCV